MPQRSLTRPASLGAVALLSAVLLAASLTVALGRASGDDTPSGRPTASPGAPAAAQVTPETPVNGTVTWKSGAWSGGSLAEHKEFAKWRQRKLGTALYFAPQDSWAALTNADYLTNEYAKDRSVLPVLSYAMWPTTERGGLPKNASPVAVGKAVFPRAAAGEFDKYWKKLAESLVSGGLPNAVIRPGWEFNGTFYDWTATGDTGAAQYAEYFRHIVRAMRSVPGARFTFSWCAVQARANSLDLVKAYPGDEYVDDIGFDVYNQLFKGGLDHTQQWQNLKSGIKYGLDWQLAFAQAHDKPVSYPEWAGFTLPTNRGSGGDDALFIRNMFAWMVAHPPAYENYFNFDDADPGTKYAIHGPTSVMQRSAETYLRLWKT